MTFERPSKEKKAQGGSFTLVLETPVACVRPKLTNGGGKGTRTSATTLHASVLETPATGPRAGMRPRVMDGGSNKAGNLNKEEEEASIIEACAIEDGMAADNDFRKEVAMTRPVAVPRPYTHRF